jgi:peptide chain release factor 1
MIPEAKLERVLDRFHAIEAQLASGHTEDFAKLSKEHSQLSPVVNAIRTYNDTRKALVDNEALLGDPASDAELKELAQEEVNDLRKRFGALERDVKLLYCQRTPPTIPAPLSKSGPAPA